MLRSAVAYGCLLVSVILFLVNGLSVLPYPGLQQDEVLFAAGIYAPEYCPSSVVVLGHKIPLMLLSYLGALKSWLYGPIVRIWEPSPWSVRVPVLALGVITILAFFHLTRSVAGIAAAALATALLATDTTFLLTTVFDWGPVALQHLLTLAGLGALVHFHRTGSRWSLRGGWFCFGLALWNKALFLWTLNAIIVAGAIVLRDAIRRHWSRRNAAEAVVCLSLGAWPLLWFNIREPGATFRFGAERELKSFQDKLHVLRSSLDGSGLFGYIVREDGGGASAAQPESAWETWSVEVSRTLGPVRATPFPWVTAASLLLLPWLRRTPSRKPLWFALITLAVTWAQMLATGGAGGSVHHAVLLWPWPHFLAAIALGEAGRRLHSRSGTGAAALVVGAVCGWNLLVTNQYRVQLIRYGAAGSWTDAIYALSESLRHVGAREIYVTDWGILDPLRFLHRGRLPLREASEVLRKEQLSEAERRQLHERLSNPGGIFIGHVDGEEQFPGVHARLLELAGEEGYEKVRRYIVRDRHGRAVFDVFGFRRRSANPDGAEHKTKRPAVFGARKGAVHLEHDPQFAGLRQCVRQREVQFEGSVAPAQGHGREGMAVHADPEMHGAGTDLLLGAEAGQAQRAARAADTHRRLARHPAITGFDRVPFRAQEGGKQRISRIDSAGQFAPRPAAASQGVIGSRYIPQPVARRVVNHRTLPLQRLERNGGRQDELSDVAEFRVRLNVVFRSGCQVHVRESQ